MRQFRFTNLSHIHAIIVFILAMAGQHAAAAVFNVTGQVTDSIGEPEIFATVRVYSKSDSIKPVSLGTTDDSGFFTQPLKKAGKYRLTVASVGKSLLEREFELTATHQVADLGTLVTHDAGHQLGEVEVVAQRPLVIREIDRLGYDVKADPDASTSNLREILRKVPLVTVDEDGTVKVKGSTDFKIYKNGRPNNSYTKNAKDIFAAIPASSIKKNRSDNRPRGTRGCRRCGMHTEHCDRQRNYHERCCWLSQPLH